MVATYHILPGVENISLQVDRTVGVRTLGAFGVRCNATHVTMVPRTMPSS